MIYNEIFSCFRGVLAATPTPQNPAMQGTARGKASPRATRMGRQCGDLEVTVGKKA
jgi:hypothetical protein